MILAIRSRLRKSAPVVTQICPHHKSKSFSRKTDVLDAAAAFALMAKVNEWRDVEPSGARSHPGGHCGFPG